MDKKKEFTRRKQYQSPRLQIYGDLRRLTLGDNNNRRVDGTGGLKTKN